MSWNIGEHRYPQVATFWKIVEDKESYAVVRLSTSRRDKEKNWHNSSWSFCRFVGNAYNNLESLREKDKIEIVSGTISREPYVDQNGEKTYPKNEQITVFAWKLYVPENNNSSMDNPPVVEDEAESEEDEENPF